MSSTERSLAGIGRRRKGGQDTAGRVGQGRLGKEDLIANEFNFVEQQSLQFTLISFEGN